jgi:hypothetical protein
MILNKVKVEDLSTFKVSVKETLRVGPAIVTFTKKDGTERVMKCTLEPSLVIHESKSIVEGVEKKERKQSDDAMAVYDLENNAWKSFRWASVINVESVI